MTKKQTAIHEAGHAVVACALGLACKELVLTHETVAITGVYGYATGPNPMYGYEHGSKREHQATMHDECIACCAGLAAEHVFFGVPMNTDNKHAQGDFENIIELERQGLRIRGKRNGFAGDESTWKYISRQLVKAGKYVRMHRQSIEQLADILVKKKRLSEGEFKRFCSERSIAPR